MAHRYFHDSKGDEIYAVIREDNRIILYKRGKFFKALEFPTEQEMHEWLKEDAVWENYILCK